MSIQNIFFVIHNLQGGGAEKVFTGLTTHFSKISQVTVITFESGGVYEKNIQDNKQIRYISLPSEMGHFARYKTLRTLFKKEKPHKVVSFLEYPNILVSWALKGTKIPHISSERTNYIQFLGNSIKDKLKLFLLKGVFQRAHKIVSVSEGLKQSLIKDFDAPENKVRVIRNGIQLTELELKSQEEIQGKYKPSRNTILAVGRFTREKNYPLLLEAFHQIVKIHPEYELCILGEGKLKEEMIALSVKLGIQNQVYFPGFESNPAPYMRLSGCFVLSSDLEGMPNALIEAYYLNGHVVSTDCQTGPSEIIEPKKDGLLVPTGEPALLAQAITKMMGEEEFRKEVRENSRIGSMRFEQAQIWKNWESVILD